MQKINILYKEDNKIMVESVNISIDEQIENLPKNEPYSKELNEGKHTVMIYAEVVDQVTKEGVSIVKKTWAEAEANISTQDLYYIFKAPLVLSGKGKLISVTKEQFDQKNKSNHFWTSPLGIVIILVIGFLIILLMELL